MKGSRYGQFCFNNGHDSQVRNFSAVSPILFQALPYPHANRIAIISDVTADGEPLDVTFGTYLEIAHRSHSFASTASVNSWQPALVGDGTRERLTGQVVGADYFRTLGVTPLLGRDFTADDDRANGPHVVILSDALWRRRFSGDRSIIGRSIRLAADDYTVVGVMPASFEKVLAPHAEVWAPLQYNLVFGTQSREWGHHLEFVARLLHRRDPLARRGLGDRVRAPRTAGGASGPGEHVEGDVA